MGALTLVLSEQSVQACEVMVTLLLALLLLAAQGWRCCHFISKFWKELIIWVSHNDSVIMQVIFDFDMLLFDLLAHCGARVHGRAPRSL